MAKQDDADDELEAEGPGAEDLAEDEPPETIPCPKCGAQVFEDSPKCPKCGQYVTAASKSAKWAVWVAMALLVIGAIATLVMLAR
jgi:hypothetical protein